ncbi:ectonucleotide pyrophosphatase/phosphodiesterase [Oceanicaulis alexandrii]|uniref:alkaline phosphatase family protein n=1 Tax=Oceanicaulis alexandrii TaxID=153233 RepID=UPI0035D0E32A
MFRSFVHTAAVCSALLLASCASVTDAGSAPEAKAQPERVLLIGLDGLRADALDMYDAPTLEALAERGARAERMIPVMPSKTFVNFYSIATGLYPENHGMTENAPYDREARTGFVNPMSAQDPFWWQGEPIWTTAEREGLTSAIMFWLGSEVAHDGLRPSIWTPYQHDKPYQERVDEVLAWYDAPAEDQPRLAAVYFDRVDSVAHRNGPENEAVAEAVADVDGYVAQLVAGLEARDLLETTNIIIVSDHGMAELSDERIVAVDDWIDFERVYSPHMEGRWGAGAQPYIFLFSEDGDQAAIDEAHDAINASGNEHVMAYKAGEMPDHYHLDHPTRGPDLLVVAEAGWSLVAPSLEQSPRRIIPGNHGYDNMDPVMGATFIAAGPRFDGVGEVAAFENVNVYLMIACALGLDPAETDGDPAEVARVTGGRCPAQ